MQFWRVNQTPVYGFWMDIHFLGFWNSLAFSGSKEKVSVSLKFANVYVINTLSSWLWKNHIKVEKFKFYIWNSIDFSLHSTAITDNLLKRFNSATAYFFFDARDSQKDFQLHKKLICSLIWQFSLKCGGRLPKAYLVTRLSLIKSWFDEGQFGLQGTTQRDWVGEAHHVLRNSLVFCHIARHRLWRRLTLWGPNWRGY